MYHDVSNLQPMQSAKPDFSLHCGTYRFYFKGAIVTGNVFQIGDDAVHVKLPFLGQTVKIPMLQFLDSGFEKL